MTCGPGMESYRPLELALYYTTPSHTEIGRSVGLGITSTLCGEVSIVAPPQSNKSTIDPFRNHQQLCLKL